MKQRRDDYGDTVKDANICTDGAPEDPTKRRARVWFLDKDNRCSPTYTNSYALVVGIGEYTPGGFWDPLPGALKDADAIAEALRSLHGFAVTSINNPTAEQLRNALAEFSSDQVRNPMRGSSSITQAMAILWERHHELVGSYPSMHPTLRPILDDS